MTQMRHQSLPASAERAWRRWVQCARLAHRQTASGLMNLLCSARASCLVRALEHCSDVSNVAQRWFQLFTVHGVRERIEQSREPRRIRRLVQLRREVERLRLSISLEAKYSASPIDRSGITDEAHVILAMTRCPGQKHHAKPLWIFEQQMRAVLHIVIAMAQAPRPRANVRRYSGCVEHLVDEMGSVIEQNAAARVSAQSTPRRGIAARATVRHQPIHVQLGEMPAPNGALLEPLPQLHPHWIVPVLVARHYHPPGRARCVGDAARLGGGERDGFLA